MARITGAVCRLCRREGIKLFLKGARCESAKCAVTRKNYPPGQHGNKGLFGQKTEYSRQLREKQKAKRIFGVSERQFRKYYQLATNMTGASGTNLLRILELRLDNVLYRSGIADSHAQARQFIGHGLIKVNGRKVKTPSIMVKPTTKIEPVDRAVKKDLFKKLENKKDTSPRWLKVDFKKPAVEVLSLPEEQELDKSIKSQLIVELYSK